MCSKSVDVVSHVVPQAQVRSAQKLMKQLLSNNQLPKFHQNTPSHHHPPSPSPSPPPPPVPHPPSPSSLPLHLRPITTSFHTSSPPPSPSPSTPLPPPSPLPPGGSSDTAQQIMQLLTVMGEGGGGEGRGSDMVPCACCTGEVIVL